MVQFARIFGSALLLASLAAARPTPEDSSLGEEVAVSAPNGIPLSDTAELAQQTGSSASTTTTSADMSMMTSMPYGGNQYQYSSMAPPQYGSSMYEPPKYQSSSYEPPKYQPSSYEPPKHDYPSYGSGKSNWGGSGYDSCVQQCVAQYGQPPSEYQPTVTSGSEGSKGNGATHTVIVAPSQGVLRYVPFAVNASVGDTILFRWNANNHTVTKSSALQPCNKSLDGTFASGTHDKDFSFTQVVNDTQPTYFYCGTPTHCQKGMFGVINPPVAFGSPDSVTLAAQDMAAKSPDMAALWSQMTQNTQGNDKVANWGGSFDMSKIPEANKADYVANVMYTRTLLAANPELLKDDGRIDLSTAPKVPLKVPQDISVSLNAAASVPAAASPSAAASAPASTTSSASTAPPADAAKSGASTLGSPRILVAAMAVFVTFLAL